MAFLDFKRAPGEFFQMNMRDWALFFAIGLILAFGFSAIRAIKTDGAACQVNPLVFGVTQAQEQVGSALQCTCGFDSNEYTRFQVTANGTKQLFDSTQQGNPLSATNYTDFLKGLKIEEGR